MDNFKQIRSLLSFENSGDFYFIQLFKRRKDNPDLNKTEKLIDSYYIFSLEEYDKIEDKVKSKCIENNARAYIRLNKRNTNDIALHMVVALGQALYAKQTNHLPKMFDSLAGKYHSADKKTWLVDIDGDMNLATEVRAYINSLTLSYDIVTIPTINGYHLITRPFNRKLFSEKYPLVDIQLDNPTLLYYENQSTK